MSTSYVVKAFCCTSGNCSTCHGGHDRSKRVVEVVSTTDDKEKADKIRNNWCAYGAFIEEVS